MFLSDQGPSEITLHPATIKLFLVHGSPSGLRTAEVSNWSGKAVAAPRTEVAALLKRSELSNPGIYLLTGVDPDSGERAIYIGEAENVATRLKGHAGKDFWNSAAVFVSKDENLTKAHIRYLEGELLTRAKDHSNSVVVNSVNSGAKLPESDAAEMNVFLEKCLQLLPVLGVRDFEKKVDKTSNSEDTLFCKIGSLTAKGQRTANGFVVFAGSQAVLKDRPSATQSRIKRKEMLERGLLVQEDHCLVFTEDTEFGSPSTAGSVIRGGNTNGLTSWKNSRGISLKKIELSEA